jgi:Rrf2 family iron-sulfur cluster assembly transcriptional regulator
MLSHTAEYALRSVLFLADRDGAPASVEEIAEALGVPRNYLSKTLHRLAQEGILHSTRGKGGGFRLGVDAETLTLLRIVDPFDQMSGDRQCLLGRKQCSDRNPCPAHGRWKAVSEQMARFFRETTVSDLVRGRRASA